MPYVDPVDLNALKVDKCDLFNQLDFQQLYSDYEQYKSQKQRLNLLKTQDYFTTSQIAQHIDPYI